MECPGQGSRRARRLGGLQHTLPHEPDVCPSLALALEQLQAMDVALDRPMAPRQGAPRCDCRAILLQALGPGPFSFRDPCLSVFSLPRQGGGRGWGCMPLECPSRASPPHPNLPPPGGKESKAQGGEEKIEN